MYIVVAIFCAVIFSEITCLIIDYLIFTDLFAD